MRRIQRLLECLEKNGPVFQRHAIIVIAITTFLFSLPTSSTAAGPFSYRKPIVINQPGGRPVLANFPFLVNINGDPDLITKVTSNDGYDIMFKDSDGITPLDFEIEYFNKGAGTLMAWVKIPSLPSGSANEASVGAGARERTGIGQVDEISGSR